VVRASFRREPPAPERSIRSSLCTPVERHDIIGNPMPSRPTGRARDGEPMLDELFTIEEIAAQLKLAEKTA
jgi:hypothetical protein